LSKNGQKSSKIVKKRPKFVKIRKIQTKFDEFGCPRKKFNVRPENNISRGFALFVRERTRPDKRRFLLIMPMGEHTIRSRF